MEYSHRDHVLVAVGADRGGEGRRLVGVVLDRVQAGERGRVRSDHVDGLLHVAHAAVGLPKLVARHGVGAAGGHVAVSEARYRPAAHVDVHAV